MARQKKQYYVITFHTTTQAMAYEKKCMEEGIPGRMIPVPREISAGCGLSWRILKEDYLEEKEKIEKLSLPYQEITELLL